MKSRRGNIWRWTAGMALGAVLTGCSLVNEDQSDCGTSAKINYDLTLVTNMTTEIETQLGGVENQCIAAALRSHLATVFTDFAHDVDLSFYDVQGDSSRLLHEQHVMDATQRSYTINLPMREYMHLAVANVQDNRQVALREDDYCHTSHLGQTAGSDTIDSHNTGLFTARQPMNVLGNADQTFNVHLYMANCAAALVVDPNGHDISGMQVYATGLATRFHVSDSSYVFAPDGPVVRSNCVENDCGLQACYCVVGFPSQSDDASQWELRVYMPRPVAVPSRAGGSVTETILHIREPLRAGQLKIIKCMVLDDGSVVTHLPEVGVSVTLDWKPGGSYHPNI